MIRVVGPLAAWLAYAAELAHGRAAGDLPRYARAASDPLLLGGPVVPHEGTTTALSVDYSGSAGLVSVRPAAVNHPLASRPTRRTPARHDSI